MAENSTGSAKRRRGPGRPFVKGQSGNPGGRPLEVAHVKQLAREHTAEAIETLVTITGRRALIHRRWIPGGWSSTATGDIPRGDAAKYPPCQAGRLLLTM